MTAGPPRPRPAPASAPLASGGGDVRRLTVPEAYHLWCGVVGYHLPAALQRAAQLSEMLRRMP